MADTTEDDQSAGGSSSSDDSFEVVDPTDELVQRMGLNDKRIRTIDINDHLHDKFLGNWEWGYWDYDVGLKENINNDMCQIFDALATNVTVREVTICIFRLMDYAGVKERDCKITNATAERLGRSLSKNRFVKRLVIYGEVFEELSGAAAVVSGLAGNAVLQEFTFIGCDFLDLYGKPEGLLDRISTQNLATMLSENTAIEKLCLGGNCIRWFEDTNFVCAGLKQNKSIKQINLRGNLFLGPTSAISLCAATDAKFDLQLPFLHQVPLLIKSFHNIQSLRLALVNDWSDGGFDLLWASFVDAIPKNNSIKSIFIENETPNRSGEDRRLVLPNLDITPFSKSIVDHGLIERLSFQEVPFDDEKVATLCKALRSSSSIREVKFTYCDVSSNAAKSLAELLRINESIISLSIKGRSVLCRNVIHIGDPGAIDIAKAVVDRNGVTRELSLASCGIGDEGVRRLLDLLEEPRIGIEKLNLHENKFEASTCEAFAKCLSRNTTLRELDLWYEPDWGGEVVANNQALLLNALVNNASLEKLSTPKLCPPDEAHRRYKGYLQRHDLTYEVYLRKLDALRQLVKVNHTLNRLLGYSCGDQEAHELLEEANSKHPIIASTIKGVPFPPNLIVDLPARAFAPGIERAEDLAGIDGIFSFVRQFGDQIASLAS